MKINQTFINSSILVTLSVLACTSVHAEDTRAPNYLPAAVTTTQPISSAKLDPNSMTAGFYITTPGYYYLSTDISYNPAMGVDNLPAILINTDNVILDLGTKNIALRAGAAGTGSEAIQIAANVKNVTIKNGSVSGFAAQTTGGVVHLLGGNSNIVIEDLTINKNTVGIPLLIDTGANIGIQIRGVQVINNANTAAIYGASITNVKNLIVSNCVFSSNSTTTGAAAGLLLSGCSDVMMENVDCSNNSTTENTAAAYGIRIASSTKNIRAKNCRTVANNNAAAMAATTALAYGLSLNASSSNYFEDCIFSSQTSVGQCYGVGLEAGSNSNFFKRCAADENYTSANTTACNVYGFYLSASKSNQFIECQANGNYTALAGAATNYYDATGFYSTGGLANIFLDCMAARNGSGGFHTDYTTTSYSSGFRLNSDRASTIRGCTSQANDPINNAGTMSEVNGIAAGILLSGTCINCTVDNNLISNNQSLTSASADTGRSIGYWDKATDSTTFLRKNISTGQGTVYNGTTVLVDPTTGASVNYYMTYTENIADFNPENIIKETDISNLNAIALAGGETLFNWSIVTNSQA